MPHFLVSVPIQHPPDPAEDIPGHVTHDPATGQTVCLLRLTASSPAMAAATAHAYLRDHYTSHRLGPVVTVTQPATWAGDTPRLPAEHSPHTREDLHPPGGATPGRVNRQPAIGQPPR